jgi:hypothetical protein
LQVGNYRPHLRVFLGSRVQSRPRTDDFKREKIPAKYERNISSAKFTAISRKFSPDSLLEVSAGIFQRAQVDESGIIRTQTGTHNRAENGHSHSAWDALYDTTP